MTGIYLWIFIITKIEKKIEGKNYLLRYSAIAGSSVNLEGNWLLYQMENKPSEHGPPYVDFETLKQNILAHEATFRMQVDFTSL